jgi:antitoxin component of MazEF toxin-antitoxin module
MSIATVAEIQMRPKRQFTLPASIAKQANVTDSTSMTVVFVNGNIILTPKKAPSPADDIMAFAGIGRTVWGNTHEESMENIRNLRAE